MYSAVQIHICSLKSFGINHCTTLHMPKKVIQRCRKTFWQAKTVSLPTPAWAKCQVCVFCPLCKCWSINWWQICVKTVRLAGHLLSNKPLVDSATSSYGYFRQPARTPTQSGHTLANLSTHKERHTQRERGRDRETERERQCLSTENLQSCEKVLAPLWSFPHQTDVIIRQR